MKGDRILKKNKDFETENSTNKLNNEDINSVNTATGQEADEEIEVLSTENEIETPDLAQEEEKTGETPNQLSETEFIRLCLQQSMNELKNNREELAKLKKSEEEARLQKTQIESRIEAVSTEYENFRRRTAEEKEAVKEIAISKAVTELLPAIDSLENAMSFADAKGEGLAQGIEMTLKLLRDGFSKIGVVEIETANKKFDPEKHNAVAHVDDESLGESVISKVYQKGYAVGDRVIRHSMVEVAN